jgi:hypothetical protein
MSVDQPVIIGLEEKQAALHEVLSSETFQRSSQLRSFLRYVCEMEIAGRTDEINEYVIGIEALGRKEGYSLAEDSAVRSRAYELRQRLERHYSSEGHSAEVRISIPKGSYVPVFSRVVAERPERENTLPSAPPMPSLVPHYWRAIALGALLIAVLLGGWCGWLLRSPMVALDPHFTAVQDAWGPIAHSASDVLVCVGTKMHLLVRPNLPRSSQDPRFPALPELYPLFRRHRPLPEGEKLFMEPADSSVAFGEVSAIATVAKTLTRLGSSYQILPERIAPLAALRDRNAVVVGIPMDSDVVTKLLSATVYTIEYNQSVDELAVIDRRKPGAVPEYAAQVAGPAKVNIVYGLITVMPSEGATGPQRQTIVFSGLGSVGTNGAADFFSTPAHVAAARERFRKQGLSGFPAAYQIVVRCKWSDGMLLSTECVNAVVLTR